MKIYIVTSGEYSDYGIRSIHESKEDAENAIKLHKLRCSWYDNYNVSEWDTGFISSDIESQAIEQGMVFFNVWDGKDGIEAYRCENEEMFKDVNKIQECGDGDLTSIVMARDEEHAVKIFADKLNMHKYAKGLI